MTEKVICTLVNGETHYKKHRQPNIFNVLVHRATDEMNTGNVATTIISRKANKTLLLDLGPGDHYTLKDIQETMKYGMKNDAFSEAYKNKALQILEDSRGVRTMGYRSSNTEAYADARVMAVSLADEVSPSYHPYIF